MPAWAKATLNEGRVKVESKVAFTLNVKDASRQNGVICETQFAGKDAPRAVVKLNRTGALVAVQFENVNPGSTIKRPGT